MGDKLPKERLENKWYIEWQTPYEGHVYAIKKILYLGETRYQRVEVVEVYGYGKCLFLDGKLQSSLSDEWIYHEALVHPAMVTHPNPQTVLVVGGGEGATLREVLRHQSVKKAYMVDVDEDVVKVCMEYLPEWHRNSFRDPRVRLLFEDGRAFLSRTDEVFDVIIADLTDPVPGTPSVKLYTKEFYELAYKKLADDGVMVTQATSIHYTKKNFAIIYNTLKKIFPIVRPYYAYIPSFVTPWGFVLASKEHDPLLLDKKDLAERLKRISGELKFYDSTIHRVLFTLPRYLRKFIEEVDIIASDENPIYMPA